MSQRAKGEQARIEGEKLAEERRLAREQALEWTREVRMDSDDEEREKRPKRSKKAKADVTSGDEGEPKKKKRGKIKKSANEQGDEDQAMFSEEDDAEKPTKKVRIQSRNLCFC
jgi:RNA polymerase-associated protein CTR9